MREKNTLREKDIVVPPDPITSGFGRGRLGGGLAPAAPAALPQDVLRDPDAQDEGHQVADEPDDGDAKDDGLDARVVDDRGPDE